MSSRFWQTINNLKRLWTSPLWTSLFSRKSNIAKAPEAQTIPQLAVPQTEENTAQAPDKKGTVKTMESGPGRILHADCAEFTVIDKGTEINGCLTSRTNIKIMGTVKGNIMGDAHVIIFGTVEGDVTGEAVTMQSGSITGNITSKTTVAVSEKSTIDGDIKCNKFSLNGYVRGDVQAQSSATLGSIAVIHGNLTSQYLSIQEGAVVDGAIKVSRDRESAMENIFQIGLKKPAAQSS